MQKWDALVASAPAGTIYACSWYLDAFAGHWSALVMDDYACVMPLPWKRKLGIRYCYVPVFCQQLGIISADVVDPSQTREFVEAMRRKFAFGHVQFNSANLVGGGKNLHVEDRVNQVLSLEPDYEAIAASYSTNAVRNLKKSRKGELEFDEAVGLEALMELKRIFDPHPKAEKAYAAMRTRMQTLLDRGRAEIYGVRMDGKLVAATLFARGEHRLIYLLSVSSDEGKEARAMFLIVDEAIRRNAGSELLLDFEGSNIPGIARFFAGFGARKEIYQSLRFSSFPLSLILGRSNGR